MPQRPKSLPCPSCAAKQKALVIAARALGVVGCDYIAKCKALLSLGLAWV